MAARKEIEYEVDVVSGCWNCTSHCTDSHGYPKLRVGYDTVRMSRFMFSVNNPNTTISGKSILHTCDNKLCINPEHLYAGTMQDNMNDRSLRGRCNAPCGDSHYKSILTSQEAREIKYDTELSNAALARMYGVDVSEVSRIKTGQRWSHI